MSFMEKKGYSLIQSGEMQEFQKRFSKSEKLYMMSFDTDFQTLTNQELAEEDKVFLQGVIPNKAVEQMKQKLKENTMEEVCQVELAQPYLRFCGVTVFLNGCPEYYWIVLALLEDLAPEGEALPSGIRTTNTAEFQSSMSLLLFHAKKSIQEKQQQVSMGNELQEIRRDTRKIEEELDRNKIISKAIRSLESEEDITVIVAEILREICVYLEIDEANLISTNQQTKTVSIISEWCRNGEAYLDRIQDIPLEQIPFLKDNSYVISSNTQLNGDYLKFCQDYRIEAIICLPIEINGEVAMYLNFWETTKKKIWEMTAIRFLHDMSKIIQSILNRRVAKNSLVSSYSALEAVLEHIGCGVFVRDLEKEELLFKNHLFRPEFESYHLLKNGTNQTVMKEIYLEEDKSWYEMQYTDIIWVDGRNVQLCTAYDITEKKNNQRKIERSANSDFLTGLYNRMKCETDLKEYISITQRHGGEGAILFFDLDDFKHINDGLGHQYGDILLRAVSSCIREIVGVENSCYRMGGDEFVIIVTNNNFHRLEEILQKLMEIFSKPWYLKNTEYYCTVSMGIVRFPRDGTEVEELMRKADIAMFEAKKSGKNRVEFYDANVTSLAVKRLDMEKNMRRATFHPEEEFEVYYQPIVDIRLPGNPCTGAEALIRWNSSNLGFISPSEFIPLAEYLGLITPIGNYVLEQACRQCRYWNDCGHPNYKVNVNLSVIQLLQNDMVDTIQRILEVTGVNPANLTLEVTESLAVNDMTYMKRILNKIRSIGVRVALDDFGTGYSSLNHIREMPLDIIKVDRCFVKDLGSDEFSDIFVRTVTQLANAIHVNICVEGVEKEEQYKILKGMKVDLIQGYYFDMPMKSDDFIQKYVL